MIIHVVLLQPKVGIESKDIDLALSHVHALQETIPGIIDIQTGKNSSSNHQDYTYGFLIRFADHDHLTAYAPHPAHRLVSDELVHICRNIIDFDLEQ